MQHFSGVISEFSYEYIIVVMTRRDNNVIIGSLWGKKTKQTSQWNGNKRDGFAVTVASMNTGKQGRTKKKDQLLRCAMHRTLYSTVILPLQMMCHSCIFLLRNMLLHREMPRSVGLTPCHDGPPRQELLWEHDLQMT
ncbi:uncharacterized protein ACIBXB_002073 [Morphnus guianensis]